jgi:hypothetical protein
MVLFYTYTHGVAAAEIGLSLGITPRRLGFEARHRIRFARARVQLNCSA